MAEENDQNQRTEQPSERKLEDARRRGQVARAQEVRHAAMLGGALIVTALMLASLGAALAPMLLALLGNADSFDLSGDTPAMALASAVAGRTGLALLPAMGLLMAAALLGGLLSGRPTIAWERIKPDWTKLSPLKGFGRLFGAAGLVEFAKTLAKLTIVAGLAGWLLAGELMALEAAMLGDAATLLRLLGRLAVTLLLGVGAFVAVLAVLDILWQRYSFLRRMRMSRQELKDELKQSEGSPEIKARVRALRMEAARRRMMAAVPKASVVIMNPTHYAVALHYDHGVSAAPRCVAKGVDAVALRIRDTARKAGVPIVENAPLARALHAAVDIDEMVPPEHFAAVAEVIGYVLRLARRVVRP